VSQQGPGCSSSSGEFLPCVTFEGPKQGYTFKTGSLGVGYHADGVQQGGKPAGGGAAQGQAGGAACLGQQQGEGVGTVSEEDGQQGNGLAAQREGGGMAKEEEAIRNAEAKLDAETAQRLGGGRFKLVPVLGTPCGAGGGPSEFGKLLSGKAKVSTWLMSWLSGQVHLCKRRRCLPFSIRLSTYWMHTPKHRIFSL